MNSVAVKTYLKEELNFFWAAIMFYTRLPVPKSYQHSQEALDGSRKFFPLIGLMVGLISALAILVLQNTLPLSLVILISMVTSILVTGAFHEDGFADSCDGLSRLGASLAIETLDYVQDIDKSKVKPMTASKLSRNELVCSILFSLPFFICLLFFKPSYLLVLVPLGITFYLCVRYFKKRIGGYTGDCLGALQQLLEVCFYLSVLALY